MKFSLPIAGSIRFGAAPNESRLPLLKKEGIDGVWNLAEELRSLFEAERSIFDIVIFSEIDDYGIPNEHFTEDLYRIRNLLLEGKNIFVHCLAGRGRTGIALACLNILIAKKSAAESLLLTKHTCFGPENEAQQNYVRALEAELLNSE